MSEFPVIRRAWLGAVAMTCAFAPTMIVAQQANPLEGDPAALRAGRELYAARCADCHGADALGKAGPDLTRLWIEGGTDERAFATIRNGVAGSIMPPPRSMTKAWTTTATGMSLPSAMVWPAHEAIGP